MSHPYRYTRRQAPNRRRDVLLWLAVALTTAVIVFGLGFTASYAGASIACAAGVLRDVVIDASRAARLVDLLDEIDAAIDDGSVEKAHHAGMVLSGYLRHVPDRAKWGSRSGGIRRTTVSAPILCQMRCYAASKLSTVTIRASSRTDPSPLAARRALVIVSVAASTMPARA
jgi:hypothetical protein